MAKIRASARSAAPGNATCAAWMYHSVIAPFECPARICTYACGFTAASWVSAVCLRPCHVLNGFVMPAPASAGLMHARQARQPGRDDRCEAQAGQRKGKLDHDRPDPLGQPDETRRKLASGIHAALDLLKPDANK